MRLRLLVGLLLLAAAPLLAQTPAAKPADPLSAQLDRIFNQNAYDEKTFGPFQWLDGGKAYTTVEPSAATAGGKDIVRYDAATGTRRVLVSASSLVPAAGGKPLAIDGYAWSKDGKKLLLFTNTKKVWRQNTRGDYWVLDLASGRLRQVGADKPASTLMFAKFSPDGGRVAYVQGNDLWVEDLVSGKVTRLTSDGGPTTINGTADWVYEEEFDIRDGFRWSPDGQDIAFWHFDASGIGDFQLINDTDTLYPVVTHIPYPKVGTTNSAVKIGIVSAAGGTPRWVDLPGDPRNMYVARMEYVDFSGEIVIQQLNRLQNTNDVWLATPATGKARRMLHDEDRAWLDVVESWQWLPGQGAPLDQREARLAPRLRRAPRRHRLAPPDSRRLRHRVRRGSRRPERVPLLHRLARRTPTRRYLYRARLDGRGTPERVTPAGQAGTHAYKISPDGKYAVHTFSTIDRPPVTDLVQLPSHRTVRVLEDNKALAAAVAPLLTPATEFFQVDIGGGVTLDGWMIKPKNFDPSRKYPLLMYVYGEPAGVQVTDKWVGGPSHRMLFHRALADAGYVVALRRQPGHALAQGTRVAQDDLRRDRRPRDAGPDRGGQGPARRAPLPRSRARRVLGLERRRLDDAEPPLPLTRPLQGRHVGRAGPRPDALRHDLPGAVHGPAAGQRARATGRARPSTSPRDSRASSSSSTAPATTTSTTRARSGWSTA